MSRLKKKVTLLNMLSNLCLQIVLIANGFIIPKLILDNFGSDVNGLISSLTQFLQYIALVDGGIAGVIIAKLYKPLTSGDDSKASMILESAKRFYRRIGFVFIVYALIIALVYPLVFKTGFSFSYVALLTVILSIRFVIQYMISLTYKTLLLADKKIYVSSFTQALISFLEIILAIVAIKIYPEVHFLKLLTAVAYIIQPIVFVRYVRRNYNLEKSIKPDSSSIKGRWDGFAINMAAFVHSGTDVAVLTIFTNLATVSVYSVYALVTGGIKNTVNSLVSSLNPTLGHAYARKDFADLNRKLDLYEYIIFLLVFLVFSVAGMLITPFVSLYTEGLMDADYNQPIFGILIVVAEALYLLKFPHLNLAYSADRFKEISIPAFVEAGLNIIVSVILVPFMGLIGVAIGTIVAMAYRLMFHVYYTTKIIPERRQWIFYRKLLLFVIFAGIGILLCMLVPSFDGTILSWVWHAIAYCLIMISSLLAVSLLFFRNEIGFLKKYLSRKS